MKMLKPKIYLQNPELAYCSLNSCRTVFDFYFKTPPSRNTLKRILKTGRNTGTYTNNIYNLLDTYDLKYKLLSKLTFKSVVNTLNKNNLMLISYKCGEKQYHSSVISGCFIQRGTPFIRLCDPWLGFHDMPFNLLQYLVYLGNDKIVHFLENNS